MTPSPRYRVLIVEDEALIRWSLRERLLAEGIEVIEAGDAATALDQISDNGISGALLDLRLPDMSGLEVLKAFRVRHPDCPVWIMTAYGTPAAEELAEKLRVREFVNKPFDLNELVQKVVSALAEHDESE